MLILTWIVSKNFVKAMTDTGRTSSPFSYRTSYFKEYWIYSIMFLVVLLWFYSILPKTMACINNVKKVNSTLNWVYSKLQLQNDLIIVLRSITTSLILILITPGYQSTTGIRGFANLDYGLVWAALLKFLLIKVCLKLAMDWLFLKLWWIYC